MKTTGLPKPVNSVQQEFLALCEKGGGAKGGPPRPAVQELLRAAGRQLNSFAYNEVGHQFSTLTEKNPWHVCFAIGLAWGHLAKLDVGFTEAAANVLEHWNDSDLTVACSYHLERGQAPIRDSLGGARQLFHVATLPDTLPNDIDSLWNVQENWLAIINRPNRPKYIGTWNATAMFMVALFCQPQLAQSMNYNKILLPTSGPVFHALRLLNKINILPHPPFEHGVDEIGFDGGALFANNATMETLLAGLTDWSMIDLHSGLYMLGTRDPRSKQWFSPS